MANIITELHLEMSSNWYVSKKLNSVGRVGENTVTKLIIEPTEILDNVTYEIEIADASGSKNVAELTVDGTELYLILTANMLTVSGITKMQVRGLFTDGSIKKSNIFELKVNRSISATDYYEEYSVTIFDQLVAECRDITEGAESYAVRAETAAVNAEAYEQSASASAESASASATTASTSATTATTAAETATAASTSASTSAETATTAANSASTSASNASTSAQSAQSASVTAQSASEAAQTASTTATTAATSAENSATSATTAASNASASATAAANSASAAATSATNAHNSEVNASASETNASTSAAEAEASAESIAASVAQISENTYRINDLEAIIAGYQLTDLPTGAVASVTDGTALLMPSLKVGIEPVQSGRGAPSPENIRSISGWTAANISVSPTTSAEDGTTYTIQFKDGDNPLTVYGGTLDVTTGELVVDRHYSKGGWQQYNSSNGYKAYKQITPRTRPAPKAMSNMISVYGSFSSSNMSRNIIQLPLNDSNMYMALQEDKSADDVEISYLLATPITYQLTPTQIRTLVGNNNIWADTGDVLSGKYYGSPS